MRDGNAGFIKRGLDGGGSPALRYDDKSRVWSFTGLRNCGRNRRFMARSDSNIKDMFVVFPCSHLMFF